MTTKTASVIFHYTGDSYLVSLMQEIIPLNRAVRDYDKVVLLKQDNDLGFVEVSRRVEMRSDVRAPTKKELVSSLKELTKAGYTIDLFVFGHGVPEAFSVLGEDGETREWLTGAELRKDLGKSKIRLRLVWQCNCYAASLGDDWLHVGAKVAVGAVGVNFYPNRFLPFSRVWSKKQSAETCKRIADRTMHRGIVNTALALKAIAEEVDLTSEVEVHAFLHRHWGVTAEPGQGLFEAMKTQSRVVLAGDSEVSQKTFA